MLRWLLTRVYRVTPRPDGPAPHAFGLDAEDVTLAAADGSRIRGWLLGADRAAASRPVPTAGRPRPAVVVMHGWGSAASDLLPAAPALVAAGFAVLHLDARGHGRSDPVRFMSMPRFAEDVEAAVTWLRGDPRIDAARIALVGHSVGAGACLLVASRDPRIAAVVSIASMAHPRETIGRTFRERRAPRRLVRAVLRTIERAIGHPFDSFAPLTTIARIRVPVLVLHGLDDTTVPPTDAVRLAEAGGPAATLRLVPGADHRSLDGFLPVVPEVVEHLAGALGPLPPAGDTPPAGSHG